MGTNKKLLGQRFAALRSEAGYNQSELAQALTQAGWPISKTGISSWERGVSLPPANDPQFVACLSGVLGITDNSLLSLIGIIADNGMVFSPSEVELIDAKRSGDLQKLIKLIADMTNR